MAVLRTESLSKSFGHLQAVDQVDYSLEEDELVSIIGPNGAGKTTFFNLLSGEYSPSSGDVYLLEEKVTTLPAHERARMGLSRVFQISNYFPELTVFENVRLCNKAKATFQDGDGGLLEDVYENEELLEKTWSILERLDIDDLADKDAQEISHGGKRRLELGMAVATNPEVLLLDEPTGGLAQEEVSEIQDFILDIASDHAVVLVEHKTDLVKDLSDRITVFHQGRILADGTVEEIENDEEVQRVYLREEV